MHFKTLRSSNPKQNLGKSISGSPKTHQKPPNIQQKFHHHSHFSHHIPTKVLIKKKILQLFLLDLYQIQFKFQDDVAQPITVNKTKEIDWKIKYKRDSISDQVLSAIYNTSLTVSISITDPKIRGEINK